MLVELLTILPADIPVWEQYRSFMEWVLDGIATFTGSAGLAVIIFTIIVKTILLPLTIKSTRSSKAMQEVAPKVKQIQKKYGKDRAKASQETMALYQAHGVNPMAGCLPMLVQIPIFYGLYFAIRGLSHGGAGLWGEGFLWLHSLADADPWHILPILAGIFQFVQSRMMRPANQPPSDDPQQKIMNTMMNFMPLGVVLFGWGFDSGPVIYWVTQSAYSVIQQWFITGWGQVGALFPWLPELPEHRRLGYRPPRDPDDVVVVGDGAAVQKTGFQGWLQRKMDEAQQAASERQQQGTSNNKDTNGKKDQADAEAVADNGTDETDGDGDNESAFAAKRRDSSSSYTSRVDAASSFKAKSRKTTSNGNEPGTNSTSNGAGTGTSTKKRARKKNRKR